MSDTNAPLWGILNTTSPLLHGHTADGEECVCFICYVNTVTNVKGVLPEVILQNCLIWYWSNKRCFCFQSNRQYQPSCCRSLIGFSVWTGLLLFFFVKGNELHSLWAYKRRAAGEYFFRIFPYFFSSHLLPLSLSLSLSHTNSSLVCLSLSEHRQWSAAPLWLIGSTLARSVCWTLVWRCMGAKTLSWACGWVS